MEPTPPVPPKLIGPMPKPSGPASKASGSRRERKTGGASRLRKSCDPCSLAKRRCDGLPECSLCSKKGLRCIYGERQKSGPKGRKAGGAAPSTQQQHAQQQQDKRQHQHQQQDQQNQQKQQQQQRGSTSTISRATAPFVQARDVKAVVSSSAPVAGENKPGGSDNPSLTQRTRTRPANSAATPRYPNHGGGSDSEGSRCDEQEAEHQRSSPRGGLAPGRDGGGMAPRASFREITGLGLSGEPPRMIWGGRGGAGNERFSPYCAAAGQMMTERHAEYFRRADVGRREGDDGGAAGREGVEGMGGDGEYDDDMDRLRHLPPPPRDEHGIYAYKNNKYLYTAGAANWRPRFGDDVAAGSDPHQYHQQQQRSSTGGGGGGGGGPYKREHSDSTATTSEPMSPEHRAVSTAAAARLASTGNNNNSTSTGEPSPHPRQEEHQHQHQQQQQWSASTTPQRRPLSPSHVSRADLGIAGTPGGAGASPSSYKNKGSVEEDPAWRGTVGWMPRRRESSSGSGGGVDGRGIGRDAREPSSYLVRSGDCRGSDPADGGEGYRGAAAPPNSPSSSMSPRHGVRGGTASAGAPTATAGHLGEGKSTTRESGNNSAAGETGGAAPSSPLHREQETKAEQQQVYGAEGPEFYRERRMRVGGGSVGGSAVTQAASVGGGDGGSAGGGVGGDVRDVYSAAAAAAASAAAAAAAAAASVGEAGGEYWDGRGGAGVSPSGHWVKDQGYWQREGGVGYPRWDPLFEPEQRRVVSAEGMRGGGVGWLAGEDMRGHGEGYPPINPTRRHVLAWPMEKIETMEAMGAGRAGDDNATWVRIANAVASSMAEAKEQWALYCEEVRRERWGMAIGGGRSMIARGAWGEPVPTAAVGGVPPWAAGAPHGWRMRPEVTAGYPGIKGGRPLRGGVPDGDVYRTAVGYSGPGLPSAVVGRCAFCGELWHTNSPAAEVALEAGRWVCPACESGIRSGPLPRHWEDEHGYIAMPRGAIGHPYAYYNAEAVVESHPHSRRQGWSQHLRPHGGGGRAHPGHPGSPSSWERPEMGPAMICAAAEAAAVASAAVSASRGAAENLKLAASADKEASAAAGDARRSSPDTLEQQQRRPHPRLLHHQQHYQQQQQQQQQEQQQQQRRFSSVPSPGAPDSDPASGAPPRERGGGRVSGNSGAVVASASPPRPPPASGAQAGAGHRNRSTSPLGRSNELRKSQSSAKSSSHEGKEDGGEAAEGEVDKRKAKREGGNEKEDDRDMSRGNDGDAASDAATASGGGGGGGATSPRTLYTPEAVEALVEKMLSKQSAERAADSEKHGGPTARDGTMGTSSTLHEGNHPPWTKEDDDRLTEAVEASGDVEDTYKERDWSHIAMGVPGRTAGECHDRWHGCGYPLSQEGLPWTTEEELILFTKHKYVGPQWGTIAHLLPQRTEEDVKSHFDASGGRPTWQRLEEHSGTPATETAVATAAADRERSSVTEPSKAVAVDCKPPPRRSSPDTECNDRHAKGGAQPGKAVKGTPFSWPRPAAAVTISGPATPSSSSIHRVPKSEYNDRPASSSSSPSPCVAGNGNSRTGVQRPAAGDEALPSPRAVNVTPDRRFKRPSRDSHSESRDGGDAGTREQDGEEDQRRRGDGAVTPPWSSGAFSVSSRGSPTSPRFMPPPPSFPSLSSTLGSGPGSRGWTAMVPGGMMPPSPRGFGSGTAEAVHRGSYVWADRGGHTVRGSGLDMRGGYGPGAGRGWTPMDESDGGGEEPYGWYGGRIKGGGRDQRYGDARPRDSDRAGEKERGPVFAERGRGQAPGEEYGGVGTGGGAHRPAPQKRVREEVVEREHGFETSAKGKDSFVGERGGGGGDARRRESLGSGEEARRGASRGPVRTENGGGGGGVGGGGVAAAASIGPQEKEGAKSKQGSNKKQRKQQQQQQQQNSKRQELHSKVAATGVTEIEAAAAAALAAAALAAVGAPWRGGARTPPTAGKSRDERPYVRKTKAMETLHTKGWNVSAVGKGTSSGGGGGGGGGGGSAKSSPTAKYASATCRQADAAGVTPPSAGGENAQQGEKERGSGVRSGEGTGEDKGSDIVGAPGGSRAAGADGAAARGERNSSPSSSSSYHPEDTSEKSKPRKKRTNSGTTIAVACPVVIFAPAPAASSAAAANSSSASGRNGPADAAPTTPAPSCVSVANDRSSGGRVGTGRNDGPNGSTTSAKRVNTGGSSQRRVVSGTESDAVGDEGHGPRRGATPRFEGWEAVGAASGDVKDGAGDEGSAVTRSVGKSAVSSGAQRHRLSPVADVVVSYVSPAAAHENEEEHR